MNDFLAALARLSIELSPRELRDALWLSQHLTVRAEVSLEPSADDRGRQTRSTPHTSQSPISPLFAPTPIDGLGAPPLTEVFAYGGDAASSVNGIVARSPTSAALRHKGEIARALRPFKRRVDTAAEITVDEEATAAQIATDGLWVPVLRPSAGRWLDLLIAVDTAPSMVVWRRTITEFRDLVGRLGAFRRLKVVGIDGAAADFVTVSPAVGSHQRLAPKTAIDASGRQVVLVITDGVGQAWRSGVMHHALGDWARRCPLAVGTVLPHRMWAGSGLRVRTEQLRAPRPGVPNSALAQREGGREVPIPVLSLSKRWLQPWAALVAGTPEWRPYELLCEPVTRRSRRRVTAPDFAGTAQGMIAEFRGAASPVAFDLACFLSAAWLNLPVMRLVQQVMLPESDTSHLAEVFLSGLLVRVSEENDPELDRYEFEPGVRDQLNLYLTRDELIAVLQRSSDFVSERFGQSLDFPALLSDPEGFRLPALDVTVGTRPLAYIAAGVLAKLGGRYRVLAERLEQAVAAPAPVDQAARVDGSEGSSGRVEMPMEVTSSDGVSPERSRGRLLLVIGSECDETGWLGIIHERAAQLQDALVSSGAWNPIEKYGPVIDPDMDVLETKIDDAFSAASSTRSTLLLAFVGHGVTASAEDFYLLARDSPVDPDLNSGFHLTHRIQEQLSRYTSVQGLVILVDTCGANQNLPSVSRRWDVLRSGVSIDLLVASTKASSFTGCFTAALARAFQEGIMGAGEYLRCADVEPAVARCPGQNVSFFAFDAGGGDTSDAGLWLVPNAAHHDIAVQRGTTVELVDESTLVAGTTDKSRETSRSDSGHSAVPTTEHGASLERTHLVGLGGTAMSGIARILADRGLAVSGSNARDSPVLAELAERGVRTAVGHAATNLDLLPGAPTTVVVSTAVRPDNPEVVAARAAGIPVVRRADALAALMTGRQSVCVAGTHGKTSTSSMLTVALQHAGLDPSFAIGGELTGSGLAAHHGTGDVFVAEADESDGSFLSLSPHGAVITNLEPDHLDHHGTAAAYTAVFDQFVERIEPGGFLVICADDPGTASLADRARLHRVVRYGRSAAAAVRLVGDTVVLTDGREVALRLQVPGEHMLLNAAAVLAAGVELGADPDALATGLTGYTGVRRRFELRGTAGGVTVYDDYAHHPTEVAAQLTAAREVVGDGRLVVVFQPHLYSRTATFATDFGRALAHADLVVVLDVYGSREDPQLGVSGALVAAAVPDRTPVLYHPDRQSAATFVAGLVREGDLVITMGAGDVTALGPELLARLQE